MRQLPATRMWYALSKFSLETQTFLNAVNIPHDLLIKFKGDCIHDDAGFLVYWPESQQGYLNEYHLLLIAAYLYKENLDLNREIDKYFEEDGNPNGLG